MGKPQEKNECFEYQGHTCIFFYILYYFYYNGRTWTRQAALLLLFSIASEVCNALYSFAMLCIVLPVCADTAHTVPTIQIPEDFRPLGTISWTQLCKECHEHVRDHSQANMSTAYCLWREIKSGGHCHTFRFTFCVRYSTLFLNTVNNVWQLVCD